MVKESEKIPTACKETIAKEDNDNGNGEKETTNTNKVLLLAHTTQSPESCRCPFELVSLINQLLPLAIFVQNLKIMISFVHYHYYLQMKMKPMRIVSSSIIVM